MWLHHNIIGVVNKIFGKVCIKNAIWNIGCLSSFIFCYEMMTESKEYMLYVLILYKNTILTESRKKNETVTFRLADNKSEIKFDIA